MKAPANLSPAELVTFVLVHWTSFRDVAPRLASHMPDENAAQLLIDAYWQGRYPPWLTALLLGCIGHPCGYETVRSILKLDSPRVFAESYASEAMVRIAGGGAARDLLETLETSPHKRSRNAAVTGLAQIKKSEFSAEEITDRIIAAAGAKRIRRGEAAVALAALGVTEEQLLKLLRSTNKDEVRLASELLTRRPRRSIAELPTRQPVLPTKRPKLPMTPEVFEEIRHLLAEHGDLLPVQQRDELREGRFQTLW